ncbi:hypothetical protein D3C76_1757730 [compost metagenome]
MTAILTAWSGGTKSCSNVVVSPRLPPWDRMTIWRSSTWMGHLVESLMYRTALKKVFQWPTA